MKNKIILNEIIDFLDGKEDMLINLAVKKNINVYFIERIFLKFKLKNSKFFS